MIYNLKEEERGVSPNSGNRYQQSPDIEDQLKANRYNFTGGTTGGVISSDEDENYDQEEEDDMIEDERRLLEEVKIMPDDVVIVASFKLPISVDRDPAGGWRIKPSKSFLYPTMFKLKKKKKMIKILWFGWPGIVTRDDKEQQEITELLKEFDCIPIFFDSQTIEQSEHSSFRSLSLKSGK
jgi:hypothetical protein